MSAPLSHWLKKLALTAPAAFAAAALLSVPAAAQNTAPPSNAPAAKTDADKDRKDAAEKSILDKQDAVKDAAKDVRDTAKDVRDNAKETVKDARDTAKDAAKDARDTTRDARDTARDAQRDVRDTTRDKVRDPRDPREPAHDQSRDARDPENLRNPNRDDRRDARDSRDTRIDAQTSFRAEGTRAADIGLWFERDTSKGLVISDVATRGAIAKLGFREGDRIVSVNGQRITREDEFITYLFADDVRTQRIKVVIIRDGREEVIIVEPAVFVEELTYVDNDPLDNFGIILDDRYDDRLVVWRVTPRSPAYYAGIRAGDVIVSLGNQRVANVAAFVQQLTGLGAGEVAVQVNRGNAPRTLHVDVPKFVARTQRRTSLRPNFDAAADRREDRLERREDRIEDRRDRRDSIDAAPAPRLPNAPAVTPALAPAVTPAPAPAPAVTPTPAPRPNPAGNGPARPGLFPRR